ncbi:hypothetical protein KTE28_11550 [Burkholderia multivorans]|uniref:hypothetical protein n=1 Tax=Burkholderia multivorans TaxID=87883 RepID=UPI001C25F631|nr:hypothetical protein [Burkholderia multivorans]MBU9374960.1 hypothetical protein [Burkholderia multivorans]MDN7606044.1 hypothetical protein [Burkholderia multivorans]
MSRQLLGIEMHQAEKDYRNKPRNRLIIRHYVRHLIDSGRIMEASFFCEKLLKESPNDIEGNKLAFLLAIAKMDPTVEKYDINLANSGAPDKDRFILHCRYYFAFFQYDRLRASLKAVLNEGISDIESFNVVIESIIRIKDADLVTKFISSYPKGKLRLPPLVEKSFKDILLTRLTELLHLASRNAHE